MGRGVLAVLLLSTVCAVSIGEGRIVPTTPQRSVTVERGAESFPVVTVTDEMRAHQRWRDVLYFVGTAYGLLTLLAILGLGISHRLRDVVTRVTGRSFVQAMFYFALFSVVLTVWTLPMDWLSGFWVPHRFDLSEQGIGGWLWDQAKGMLVGIVIGAPLVGLVLYGIRTMRRWWLGIWLGSIPIVIFLVLIGPVVLDPVFNDFKPLEDPALKQELLDLASRARIEGGRVFQVDRSKQTKTMNAYVNGLGPTKRIVLWDTIIAKMSRGELAFVMAHEMGHYVLHHMWKSLAFIMAALLAVFWVGQRVVERASRRWGRSWGFEDAHDPAAIPLLLATVTAGIFLLSPVLNLHSRSIEHEADLFALELTHANLDGARAFVKFAEDSKVVPDPHPFIRVWRYSHPTLAERIELCRTYRPRETGEPNIVWQGSGGGG